MEVKHGCRIIGGVGGEEIGEKGREIGKGGDWRGREREGVVL